MKLKSLETISKSDSFHKEAQNSAAEQNTNASQSVTLQQISENLLPLQALNKKWYLQPELIASIVTSIIALVIALGIIERFVKWFYRARIKVKNFVLTSQTDTLSLGRIRFVNEGGVLAEGVEAIVEDIVDNGVDRQNLIPVPLGWTHSGAFLIPAARRDIYPKQSVFLDLFEYFPAQDGNVVLKVEAGQEIPHFTNIQRGVTKIYIRLNDRNGVTIKIVATITWKDDEDPTVSLKYINRRG